MILWTIILIPILIIAIIGLIYYYLRAIYFFRDPQRVPAETKNVVISPADGKVIYIKEFKHKIVSTKNGSKINLDELSKTNLKYDSGYIIGVYMSPLDVHFNRAPINGKVKFIKHTQAKINLPMVDLWEYARIVYLQRAVDLFGHRYHLQNERNTVIFANEKITVSIIQIADKFVNKIDCFIKTGQDVEVGQKIGFIKRGSQVDIILPKTVKIKVKFNDKVYAGKTLIARF